MQSYLDASSELFLSSVGRVQRNIERVQRRITSGKRVEAASDAPDQVSTLLQLHVAIDRNQRIKANLGRASTEADVADSALNQAARLLDRALVLASQATNGTLDSGVRATIGEEIRAIQEQMVSITRTAVEGRYIFGGDDDQNPPYEIDWTAGTGVAQLTLAGTSRRVEDPAGGSFEAARSAQYIFASLEEDGSPSSNNVFHALNSVRLAIEADDIAGILAGMDLVREASTHVSRQAAFYGALQNRIASAVDFAGQYDLQMHAELSEIEDADLAAAAMELTQNNVHLQAAMAARARQLNLSLFDVLK